MSQDQDLEVMRRLAEDGKLPPRYARLKVRCSGHGRVLLTVYTVEGQRPFIIFHHLLITSVSATADRSGKPKGGSRQHDRRLDARWLDEVAPDAEPLIAGECCSGRIPIAWLKDQFELGEKNVIWRGQSA